MSLYDYVPHPRIAARREHRPRKGKRPTRSKLQRQAGEADHRGVGTMWCAYVFAALSLVALPQAIKGGSLTIVQWISQTFLQLILLSIIMVGQQVISAASDERAAHL